MHKKTFAQMGMHASLLLLAILFGSSLRDASAVENIDCVGKPHGTKGCPLFDLADFAYQPPATCGDYKLDPGEECDEGSFNQLGVRCTEDCLLPRCGDSVVSPKSKWYAGEECEPETGYFYVLDTTSKLKLERRYLSQSCGFTCTQPVCTPEGKCAGGCTWVDTQKSCSDPANTSGGASPAQGTAGIAASASSVPLSPNCGNGKLDEGEQCDDGNAIDRDLCPNTCKTPLCGNGVREGREECDDGNQNNLDVCPNDCALAVCGDGVREGPEQCDDGNVNNLDACLNSCQVSLCGNGVTEGTEECDDGNRNSFDLCPNDCALSVCGDGVREGREQCDDGNVNGKDQCTNTCEIPLCGNGVVEGGEACDDGNRSDRDSCSNSCTIPSCGDGILQAWEACDDGNQIDTDACANTCHLPLCGNGVREGTEQCDDGNMTSLDACTNKCTLPECGNGIREGKESCDQGFDNSDTRANACRLDCSMPRCGDRAVDRNEECDGSPDCSSDCRLVSGITQWRNRALFTGGVFGGAAAILSGLGVFYRRRVGKFFHAWTKKSIPKSLDDIPLDEIEMPWHKW